MDQSIIELFNGAKCTWCGKNFRANQSFIIGLVGSITIDQIYRYHMNYKKEKLLKIISIDLADSKLGELLKEFDNKK